MLCNGKTAWLLTAIHDSVWCDYLPCWRNKPIGLYKISWIHLSNPFNGSSVALLPGSDSWPWLNLKVYFVKKLIFEPHSQLTDSNTEALAFDLVICWSFGIVGQVSCHPKASVFDKLVVRLENQPSSKVCPFLIYWTLFQTCWVPGVVTTQKHWANMWVLLNQSRSVDITVCLWKTSLLINPHRAECCNYSLAFL